MTDAGYYSQANHGPFEAINIGNLLLEDGGTIRDCHIAVATQGTLNAGKTNAVLIPTWYSGTSKIMETVYTGAGRTLDPARYFLIFVNQIGNGLSTSPSNTPGAGGAAGFPHVRIGDDIRAQYKLVTEHYGLTELALVMGGSMGAQQAYEWAVAYPDFVRRCAPVAGTARNTNHDFLYTKTLMDAITSDPGYRGGAYGSSADVQAGLRRHAELWTVMGWSTEFFAQGRPAQLGFSSMDDFVTNFMCGYFGPMDPNNLLTMAWKWQRGDVSRHTGGDLAAALGRITAKTFVMPISHDMFFPPADCAREQAMVPGSELRVLNTVDGHLGLFGTDASYAGQLDGHLADLMAM